jgi:hypothetical protein
MIMQHVFIGKVDLTLTDLTPHEGRDWRFFTPDELEVLPIAFGFKDMLHDYFKRTPNVF